MSINLKKNEKSILDAWHKVTEHEDFYDWALFGYEGKSFDLKVEAIGSGGIEAIAEEFNDGKIQYGYVRVLDPNTKLAKFLLINFQGEAVLDLVHKGTCSNHIRDVSRLLKNQLTITASSSDELDEDAILKKLLKITSAYNFESRSAPSDEKFVIGTNYSKVVPKKEIDCVKRDEFWRKEEEIEKARVAAELEAKRLENLKLEEERLKREQREHLKREQFNKELDGKKNKIPEPKAEVKTINPINNVDKDEQSGKPRAEELRMERRKEAQELIGNKVNTAKIMFQQQAAQSVQPTIKVAPPAKPIRKTIHKNEPEQLPQTVEPEPIVIAAAPTEEPEIIQPEVEEVDNEQFQTIKRSPKTPTTPENNNCFIISDNVKQQNVVVEEEKEELQQIQIQQNQQPDEQQQQPESLDDEHLLKAVALYDYQASDDTEISFDPGDLITHIDCIDAGWWQGYSVRFGTYGLFPANYVQVIDDTQITQ